MKHYKLKSGKCYTYFNHTYPSTKAKMQMFNFPQIQTVIVILSVCVCMRWVCVCMRSNYINIYNFVGVSVYNINKKGGRKKGSLSRIRYANNILYLKYKREINAIFKDHYTQSPSESLMVNFWILNIIYIKVYRYLIYCLDRINNLIIMYTYFWYTTL